MNFAETINNLELGINATDIIVSEIEGYDFGYNTVTYEIDIELYGLDVIFQAVEERPVDDSNEIFISNITIFNKDGYEVPMFNTDVTERELIEISRKIIDNVDWI